jgi:hypothetical protein
VHLPGGRPGFSQFRHSPPNPAGKKINGKKNKIRKMPSVFAWRRCYNPSRAEQKHQGSL